MAKVDLWLDDDDIAAANSAGSFLFTVPEDAVTKGDLKDLSNDKAKASWIQRFEIAESKVYEDTQIKGKQGTGDVYTGVCFELKFQVPPNSLRPNGSPDPNAGKSHTAWYRIVQAGLKDKNHPKYKANTFNLSRLNGVLRSIFGASVIPHGSKTNLSDFFDGSPAPVLNKSVTANVKQSNWDGKRRDELTDFIALEDQNG